MIGVPDGSVSLMKSVSSGGFARAQVQVGVAEPHMDLHGPPASIPDQSEAQQRGVGEPRGPDLGEPPRRRLRDRVGRRARRVEVEPVPVRHDALRPDGAGLEPLAQPVDERGGEPAASTRSPRRPPPALEPDDLAGRRAGCGRHPRRSSRSSVANPVSIR